MIKSLVNYKFHGFDVTKLNDVRELNPDYYVEYEPSITDQTFNISVQSQVEDFIASGKLISAMHQGENVEVPVSNRLESFYGDDLPDVTQRIYAFNEKQRKLEEEQRKLDAEKEKIHRLIEESKKSSQAHED